MIIDLRPIVGKTIESHVYEALREEIVGGLQPGTPLRLVSLAEQLGVSTMPVRAALIRLQQEGLVRHLGRRAAVVAPLEIEDLEEIQAIRAGIEGFAARLGAEKIDRSGLAHLSALLGRLERLAAENSLDAYLSAHWQLHETCYRAAGRPRLLGLVKDYERRAERYIRLAVGSPAGLRGSIVHQEDLVAACRAHDGDAAERTIRGALAWTVERLRAWLASPKPRGTLEVFR